MTDYEAFKWILNDSENIPKNFSNLLMEKTKEIWSTATIEIMDTPIREFSKTALRYELSY